MTWGIFAIIGLGLFLTYVIWQETRSHLQWRALVAGGDVWAIRELAAAEIDRWHRIRPPAGVTSAVWAGVQTVELVSISDDHIQVACGAEAEYRMAGSRRELVTSALDAAMRLAVRVVEMVLYDIPEVKINMVRVDIYSTLASVESTLEQRCILTTTTTREAANEIDWEAMTRREIIERLDSRFEIDEHGNARAINPGESLPDASGSAAVPAEVLSSRQHKTHSASDD